MGDSPQFTGINAYAESYFRNSLYNNQLFNSTSMTSTKVSHFSPRSIAEIHFATPFVYLPLKGASESLGIMPDVEVQTVDGGIGFYTVMNTSTTTSTSYSYHYDDSKPDYGYVPQALIDWMARDPDYASRYPYIASCYPGGPSIKPDRYTVIDGQCTVEPAPLADAQTAVPDLTIATHVTVSSAGCFHPGACPTPAPAATPKVAAAAHTGPPVTSEEASVISPTPEKSQNQQTAVTNSPTTAPGLGGIIASALGGNPFPPPPSAPSSNAPAPEVPSLNTPEPAPDIPSPNVPLPSLPTSNRPISSTPPPILSTTNLEGEQNPPSSYAISLAPSASVIVINGVTSSVPSAGSDTGNVAGSPIISVGSQSITLNSASQLVVAGQTLIPGAPAISIEGTPVSLDSSANAVVVGSSTIALPSAVSAPAITIGSQPVILNSASQYVVAGATLTPGGPAIDIQGTPVSLAPSASAVVVAGSTILLSPTSASLPTLIIGSHTFTANSASAYVIGGQTLVPDQPAINVPGSAIGLLTTPPSFTVGGQIITPNPTAFTVAGTTVSAGGPGVTVSGTLVSLGPSGTLVIGTSTTVLADGASSSIFTVGGQTFTANPTAFPIAGTTLSAGGPGVTIAGTPVSLAPAGNLIVGNRTTALAQTSSRVQSFTGAAGRKGAGIAAGGLVGACAVMLVL